MAEESSILWDSLASERGGEGVCVQKVGPRKTAILTRITA